MYKAAGNLYGNNYKVNVYNFIDPYGSHAFSFREQ